METPEWASPLPLHRTLPLGRFRRLNRRGDRTIRGTLARRRQQHRIAPRRRQHLHAQRRQHTSDRAAAASSAPTRPAPPVERPSLQPSARRSSSDGRSHRARVRATVRRRQLPGLPVLSVLSLLTWGILGPRLWLRPRLSLLRPVLWRAGYGYGYPGDYGYAGGGGGGGYSVSQSYRDNGSLRLKINPKEAQIYIDGYFVGSTATTARSRSSTRGRQPQGGARGRLEPSSSECS